MTKYLSTLANDIMGAYQIPGGSVLGQAIQDLFKKRMDAAREILIEEIRAGEKDIWEACDVDEVVAIVYRYMRAAQEGTARANLRLLARIVCGQKEAKALKASDFLYYADIIASLRREEIILLGTLKRKFVEAMERQEQNPPAYAQKVAMEELLSQKIFDSNWDFWATAGATTRTGLLLSQAVIGGTLIQLTPLYTKLEKLASLDGLLDESMGKAE